MDQRVDNERRPDPERLDSRSLARKALEQGAYKGSWRERFGARRNVVFALAISGIILAALVAAWWLHSRNYESTDDAFIDTRIVQISSQVAAAIVDVPVSDNQLVDAGTELVRLDDRDYVAQRDQAQAQVKAAEASVQNLTAQIEAQKAKVDQAHKQVVQAQAALTFARQQAERYQQLASRGSGTVEQAQQFASNLQQSDAALAAAQANAAATEKQVVVLEAQRDLAYAQLAQARATLQQAATNLARTIISAPLSGRVTKLTAAKGAYAWSCSTRRLPTCRCATSRAASPPASTRAPGWSPPI
jgi:membrane fusion protein (multidrug efflux system)